MWLGLFTAWSCTSEEEGPREEEREVPDEEPRVEPSNVLIIVLDDVGIDKVASYGVGVPGPATPTLDALAARGVRFRNAWSYPTCSPTRAALLTGRHTRRYGIGTWISPTEEPTRLPQEEITLPEMLRSAEPAWDSALVGKWHLTTFLGDAEDLARDPLLQGFGWHGGSLANLGNVLSPERPGQMGYSLWEKATNGVLTFEERYVTTVTTDDGIARIQEMSEPWLLVVAYNAAHVPLSTPPPELVGDPAATLFDSVVQAADREMGRLLEALPLYTELPTTIVLTSDNGTPHESIHPDLAGRGSKGSPYELGVRVPLIVSSPLFEAQGTTSDALVHLVDLFATVAELAGVDLSTANEGEPIVHDSISLVPYLRDPSAPSARSLLFSEAFYPNGPPPYSWTGLAVRSQDLKYVRNRGSEELYTLGPDGLEDQSLLLGPLTEQQQQALDEMRLFADENAARPYEY